MQFHVIDSSVVIKELGGVSTRYSDSLSASRKNLNDILKIYNIKKHPLYFLYRYLEKLKQFHLIPHKYDITWLYKK